MKTDDPGLVVAELFQWSRNLVGIDGAIIFLRDGTDLVGRYLFEVPPTIRPGLRLSLSAAGPIQNSVVRNAAHMLSREEELSPNVSNPWNVAVSIPLPIDDIPIGTFVAGWAAPYDISSDALLVLEGAASMAASSFHRARLLYDLKREEQRLRSLLDRLPIPAVGYSAPGMHIDYLNAESRRLIGNARGKTVWQAILDLNVTPLDGPPIAEEETTDASLFPDRVGRFQLTTPDGTTRTLFPYVARLGLDGGVIMLVDITQETNLELHRKRLVRMIGHHLRTPLTPLLGYAQLIASTEHDDHAIHEAAGEITRAVDQLTDHVERLEQIAELQPVDAASLDTFPVRAVIAEAWGAAEGSPEELATVGDLNTTVLCKAGHVVSAMSELFTNSYIHGKPPVEVTVSAGPSDVEIRIRDFGRGITKEWESAVFAPYMTAQHGYLAPPPGHIGLGLSLARGLIEATYGRLTHREGVFVIQLPAGDA